MQLSNRSPVGSISAEEFYRGEEPTYNVVVQNIDVIRSGVMAKVNDLFNKLLVPSEEKLLPIVFLTGSFGVGKSTVAYRCIHDLIEDSNDYEAFEVTDISNLKPSDLLELFTNLKCTNILILCNEIEVDSSFKQLMSLRNKLSTEQISEFNILFISTIRENILEKYFRNYKYRNVYELSVDHKLTESEAIDLLEKLNETNLIQIRDQQERQKYIRQIKREYKGDTFVTILNLVTGNSLSRIVREVLNQIDPHARQAIKYTSLFYQFKIHLPVGLLREGLSCSWSEFEDNILRTDCKGILIEERKEGRQFETDLLFRTKHSIISSKIVEVVYSNNEDKIFSDLRKVFTKVYDSRLNAQVIVDFLKAARRNRFLNMDKINKLYDLAANRFETNPHFNLHYAINLEHRNTKSAIKRGIERILIAEGYMESRNHRLIHRRAVLNFLLAKKQFDDDPSSYKVEEYLSEARELFIIKRIEDPFSSYSYKDYVAMELWVLNNITLDDEALLQQHINIQMLFDNAENSVQESKELILKLKSKYLQSITAVGATQMDLNQYLNKHYGDPYLRPYVLVLKYNYCFGLQQLDDCAEIIEEMEEYTYNNEVSQLLFKYYGRNLHIPENRIKLFNIIKAHPELKEIEKLYYNYYSYIAESYHYNFKYARQYSSEILNSYSFFSPDVMEPWRKEDGSQRIFDGIAVENTRGYIMMHIKELQLKIPIVRTKESKSVAINNRYKVVITFYIKGMRATIL